MTLLPGKAWPNAKSHGPNWPAPAARPPSAQGASRSRSSPRRSPGTRSPTGRRFRCCPPRARAARRSCRSRPCCGPCPAGRPCGSRRHAVAHRDAVLGLGVVRADVLGAHVGLVVGRALRWRVASGSLHHGDRRRRGFVAASAQERERERERCGGAGAHSPSAATPMLWTPSLAVDRGPVPRLTVGLFVASTSPQVPAAASSE